MIHVTQQKEMLKKFTYPSLLELCHVLLRRRGDRAGGRCERGAAARGREPEGSNKRKRKRGPRWSETRALA